MADLPGMQMLTTAPPLPHSQLSIAEALSNVARSNLIAPTCGGLHGKQFVTVHGPGFDSLGGLGLDGGGVPLESPWQLGLILALAIIAAAERAKAKRAKKALETALEAAEAREAVR
jgi:hypothetical protein